MQYDNARGAAQAKAPIVEELEEHLTQLAEHRADAYAARVMADEAAETDVASAAVTAAIGVLSRGGALSGGWRLLACSVHSSSVVWCMWALHTSVPTIRLQHFAPQLF